MKAVYGGQFGDEYIHHEIAKLNPDGDAINNQSIIMFNWEGDETPPNRNYMNFAISDGYLYAVYYSNATQKNCLNKYKINKDTMELTDKSFKILDIDPSLGEVTINDVIVKNNNLYILCNDFENNYGNLNGSANILISRGALIVTNLNGEGAEVIGWSSTANHKYPASKESNKELFGPQKFISIEENKLLIADDGTFEKNNINRIGTFDINSKSFTFEDAPVDIKFNEEYQSY